MADMSTVEDIDIENMKVIDLKKKLKDLGLPVTGNKPELVERLQDALISGSDIAGIDSKGVDSSELDSALLLGTESVPSSQSLTENSKLLEEELLFSSPEKENVTGKELQAQKQASTKPLKKRLIVESNDVVKKPAKKIVLKRDNIIIPKSVNEMPASPVKSVDMSADIKSKVSSENEAGEDKSGSDSVVPLSHVTVKKLSDTERINLRAKRFNITAPETTSMTGKVSVSITKNKLSNVFSSSVADAPSLDVLRKRAERFGQNVSSTLKKLEEQEKLLKRKSKFGATIGGVISLDEQAKKKKRAERFAT